MAIQYGVNITTIALIYSYLANNNYSLDMSTVNNYLEYIKEKLIKKYQMYDIDLSIRNSDIFLNSFFITGGLRNNKMLMLNLSNNLEDIYNHYSNYIPSELITESLDEQALQIIGVDKNNLKIHTESKIHTKTEEVFEKNVDTAVNFVKNKNSNLGTLEVKIIKVSPKRKENDIVYNIDISYIRTNEWLNKVMFTEKQKTKKKIFTSHYVF